MLVWKCSARRRLNSVFPTAVGPSRTRRVGRLSAAKEQSVPVGPSSIEFVIVGIEPATVVETTEALGVKLIHIEVLVSVKVGVEVERSA